MVLAGAYVGQPSVAHRQQNNDAEDQVVNMPATVHDEMEWGNIVQNGEDYGTDSGKGQKEAYRSQEEAALRPVWDALVDDPAQRRALGQQKHESRRRDCEQKDEPRVGHAAIRAFLEVALPGGSRKAGSLRLRSGQALHSASSSLREEEAPVGMTSLKG